MGTFFVPTSLAASARAALAAASSTATGANGLSFISLAAQTDWE